jgi:hypothetical protein
MKTAIAISPTTRNVLSVAKIPPAAVTASQMARIAPRTVPMIRPMYPVCAWRPRQAAVVPARRQGLAGRLAYRPGRRLVAGGHSPAAARYLMTAGPPGPAATSWPGDHCPNGARAASRDGRYGAPGRQGVA